MLGFVLAGVLMSTPMPTPTCVAAPQTQGLRFDNEWATPIPTDADRAWGAECMARWQAACDPGCGGKPAFEPWRLEPEFTSRCTVDAKCIRHDLDSVSGPRCDYPDTYELCVQTRRLAEETAALREAQRCPK